MRIQSSSCLSDPCLQPLLCPSRKCSAAGLSNTILQLGVITGTMLGGSIMDSHGSVFLYRGAALLVTVTLIVYLAVTLSYTGASSMYKGRQAKREDEVPLR